MSKTTGKAAAANDTEQAQIDAAVLDQLRAYQEHNGLSQQALATRLGYSSTYVSRAFSGTFAGNAKEFEDAAHTLLSNAARTRSADAVVIGKGFLVEPMASFLDTVLHTQDIGVAWCDAGRGKTCGIHVYAQTNATCIVVTARKSLSGWYRLRDEIIAHLPNKRRLKGESWDALLQRVFTGSGRLLIIDNAHLLTESARAWLAYDWHETTGCPVALVGNPQIVEQWKRNDQHHSRVGLAREIKPAAKAADTAREVLRLHLPEGATDTETCRLATEVLKCKGAARSLKKHALLAAELMKAGGDFAKPAAAFRAAHTQLLTDARLTA